MLEEDLITPDNVQKKSYFIVKYDIWTHPKGAESGRDKSVACSYF